ncbi:MAG: phosphoribosylglycinamide formyltransferase [Flavobacteriales bacterium]|jgi:phosphoribosylglycinamide formyltransferase-1|nr:phosphoribosylglycinamide formyltransferase [Flavobacteriales bacterium]
MKNTIRLALFASGSGSNVENITNYFSDKENIEIDVVFANRRNAFVFERAKKLGIPAFYCPKNEFQTAFMLHQVLKERKIDFIILAGFLLKVPEILIKNFPNKIINIHPALLPKYGGKGMYGMNVHHAVVANQEKETGISIHLVNENYDEGKLLFQAKTALSPEDDASVVAKKVHELEYEHFPKVIESYICKNQ